MLKFRRLNVFTLLSGRKSVLDISDGKRTQIRIFGNLWNQYLETFIVKISSEKFTSRISVSHLSVGHFRYFHRMKIISYIYELERKFQAPLLSVLSNK